MEIEANFLTDLTDLCRKTLEQNGFRVRHKVRDKASWNLTNEPVDPAYYVIQYANVELRSIEKRPRNVARHPSFVCPQSDCQGLAAFLEKVEAGDDLMPHVSRQIKKADFADALFNDWGIHHFHLGIKSGSNGLVEGTRNVLFAMVTEDVLYCIDVFPHKDANGNPSWARRHLIQVVHDNWPALLAGATLALGLLPPSLDSQATEAEILELRDAGVCAPVTMADGTTYVNVGGGYTTSRDSLRAVRRASALRSAVADAEQHLRATISDIAAWAGEQGHPLPASPRFRLQIEGDTIYGVEQAAGVRVKLGMLPGFKR